MRSASWRNSGRSARGSGGSGLHYDVADGRHRIPPTGLEQRVDILRASRHGWTPGRDGLLGDGEPIG